MAYDPTAQNYGRAQRGQLSPFRDTAQRRHAPDEDEEEMQQTQEPAPSPLAKAIAPKQAAPIFSQQKTQPVVDQARSEAATGSASPTPAKRASVSPGPMTYSASDTQGNLVGATASGGSPLEKAIAPVSGGGQGYTLTGRGGAGGGSNQFAGFDFGQSDANRDTGKSAKYAFADLAAQSGAAQPTTKADAEAWFRQYIEPGMNALGHQVLDVKGDKALIRNWQGEGWVDFVQNADGADPMLAWQAEGMGGGATDPLATAVGGSAADPVAMTLAQQLGIDTSNPLWKQILDQLIADQSGQTGNTPPHATVRV